MVDLKETDMSLNPNSATDLLCDLEQCKPLFKTLYHSFLL